MNATEAKELLEGADLIFTAEQVKDAVERMAKDISGRLGDEFPLVLSVMGGAAVFTGQLLPQMPFPLEFGAIEVTRYGKSTTGREITWRSAPRDNVRGRKVLVVDDILDEGITLSAIKERLLEMGATQVWTAVFCEKDLGREKPIKADFIGITVPNRYVFGYGMDAYGLWRNLPAIYALKNPK